MELISGFETVQLFYYSRDKQRLNAHRPAIMGDREYYPTSLSLAYAAFYYLFCQGILKAGQLFAELGSGDGRILNLAALFRLKGIGFELTPELAKESIASIDELFKGPKELKPKVFEDDFLLDDTYKRAGIQFGHIQVFYHYINSEEEIAEKINRMSKKGTIFIAVNPGAPINYDPLKFQFTLISEALFEWWINNSMPLKDRILHTKYKRLQNFHIYKKE